MRRRILPPLLVAIMVFATVATGAAMGTVGAQSADAGDDAALGDGVQFDHNETHNETVEPDNETDDNETVEEDNETEGNETDAFGQLVAEFVHNLQDQNDTEGPFGLHVASFVLANNPAAQMGLIPDHAGPPENKTVGPPENKTAGPPDDAGPPENKTDGGPPEDSGNNDTEAGQPDDAGPPSDD